LTLDFQKLPNRRRIVAAAILDDVAKTHREVVIAKRGKPVARVVPAISDQQREEELLATLRCRARMLVSEKEFLNPLTAEAGWHLRDGG